MTSAPKQDQSGPKPQTGAKQRVAESTKHGENPRGEQSPKEGPKEVGGPSGPEPTRYGDWERAGRCVDF